MATHLSEWTVIATAKVPSQKPEAHRHLSVEVLGFLGKSGCRDFFRSCVCDDLIMGNEERRRGAEYVIVLKVLF